MKTGPLGVWICLALVVLSTITDIAGRRIPNVLTLGGIAVGIAIQAAIGWADGGASTALHGVGRAAIGIALCAVLPMISFVRGEMGGGDVKLFAAMGALMGPTLGIDAEAWAFVIIFLVVTPIRLLRGGHLRTSMKNAGISLRNMFTPASRRVTYDPIKLRPVIMAPTILAGLCISLVRHWPSP